MPCRFTITEKWKDLWFRKLSVEAKLLFNYLCDNCDIAGFWEIDFERASFETGLPLKEDDMLDNCRSPFISIGEVFEELKKSYIREENIIWIRNFLYHQKNLPLNPQSTFHKGIIKIINSHNSLTNKVLKEIELIIKNRGLIDPNEGSKRPLKGVTGNIYSKGNSNKGGSKGGEKHPTLEEFLIYITKNKLNIKNAENLFRGYSDGGWIDTRGKPVKNWKLKLRTLNNYADNDRKYNKSSTAENKRDFEHQESRFGKTIDV